MRVLPLVVFMCLFALASRCTVAQEPSATPPPAASDKHPSLVKLLDADVAQDERLATLAQFDKEAVAGRRFAQYVVGSIYRAGKMLPSGLVERDTARAGRYLSTAAGHGELHAMAKMAEIELSDGHYLEAMIWAQLYGHYVAAPKLEDNKPDKPGGYFADLLHRIYAHFDDKQMSQVAQFVGDFIAAHDADIQAGLKSSDSDNRSAGMREERDKMQFQPLSAQMPQHHRDCYAEYLVEFAADGTAKQAWILDALPDIQVGKDLRAVAMRMRVNPVDAPASRFAVVPLDFSFGQYALHKAK